MLGYSTLKDVFTYLLQTNIVSRIYHSVTISEKAGVRFPAYRLNDNLVYIGVDDTKQMNCYIRQTGVSTVKKTEFIGGCTKAYFLNVPYRIVFFNDYEKRNFDDLNAKILQCTFIKNVSLVSFYNDANELLRQETTPERFTLGGSTFYKAIDVMVSFLLTSDNCNNETGCLELSNPIIKQ